MSLCWIPFWVKNLVKGLNYPPQSDYTALMVDLNKLKTIFLKSLKVSKVLELFLTK